MEKRKTRTKSDEDFFKERVNEHVEDSKGLEECAPGVVNNYDAHSLDSTTGLDSSQESLTNNLRTVMDIVSYMLIRWVGRALRPRRMGSI